MTDKIIKIMICNPIHFDNTVIKFLNLMHIKIKYDRKNYDT